MLGLFSLFGRSRDQRLLDDAMRAAGLHPALVPDAVQLTIMRLLRQSQGVTPQACAHAAELTAYCMLGGEGLAGAAGSDRAAAAERRIEDAIAAGDSPDARLVLLLLHAELMDSAVLARYGLESAPEA